MNVQQFLQYTLKPENITISDMQNLESVIESFPYFQAARALYIKSLYNTDSYKYNFELKKTAALTTERDVLFDFITSKYFSNQNSIQNILDIKVNDYEIVRAFPPKEESLMILENMKENHILNTIIETSKLENPNNEEIENEEVKLTNLRELLQEKTVIIGQDNIHEVVEIENNSRGEGKNIEINTNEGEKETINSVFFGEDINANELNKNEESRKFFKDISQKSKVEDLKQDHTTIFEISEETFKGEFVSSDQNLESKEDEEAPFVINFEPIYEKLQIGKPIPFEASEKHSFFEWLKIADIKPIDRTEKKVNLEVSEVKKTENFDFEIKKNLEKSKKIAIIDQFLVSNPKISPAKKSDIVAPKIIENTDRTHLMTETLAKVYLEQKKYDKAIQAFQILILKNPEKSVYFADRIKDIKILQQNNS